MVEAAQADRLVDTVGVNTHFTWRNTPFAQTGRVVEQLRHLGVRYVRDRITPRSETREAFRELASSGIRVVGHCGALGDPETMAEVMDEVVTTYPDPGAVFEAFEGVNEPNNDGVPWIEETRSKTEDLHRERNARGLEDIPIIAPGLARVNGEGPEGGTTEAQSAALGDLTEFIDLGNIHVYPREQTPSADIDRFTAYQRMVCGDLPIVCTEAGYFNAMEYEGGAWPTPEDVAATYLPKLVLEHWIRGTRQVYLYELLDRYDPSDSVRLSSFGLVGIPEPDPDAPWRLKPSYTAIRNLLAIMADPGEPHSVGGLPLAVEGGDDLRTALFAKRDGSRYLVLWRDVSSYDAKERNRLTVDEQVVTASFGTARDLSLYRPQESPDPTLQRSGVTSIDVPVADELLVLRID